MSTPNTMKLLGDVQNLAVDMIGLVKKGHLTFGSVTIFFALLSDIKAILADAPPSLPELENLSADDLGQVTAEAYKIVAACLAAVKS